MASSLDIFMDVKIKDTQGFDFFDRVAKSVKEITPACLEKAYDLVALSPNEYFVV